MKITNIDFTNKLIPFLKAFKQKLLTDNVTASVFMGEKNYMLDIPIAENNVKNPLFIDAEGNPSLEGWNVVGNGITIEVMHPYTKGFSSPYISKKRENQVENKADATTANPYWAGVYKSFGGANGFSEAEKGSLKSGWDNINGNILKITYDGSDRVGSYLKVYPQHIFNYLGIDLKANIKMFLFIEKGLCLVGKDAGYRNGGSEILSQNNWTFITTSISLMKSMSGSNKNALLSFGFKEGVASEIYMALPALTVNTTIENKTMKFRKGQ